MLKTNDFVSIMVSRENHRKLALLANKTQIFNDVISDLIQLKLKQENKKEMLQTA
jgi:hypothetical protein